MATLFASTIQILIRIPCGTRAILPDPAYSKASFFVTKYMRTVLFTILAAYRAAAHTPPPPNTHSYPKAKEMRQKDGRPLSLVYRRFQRLAPPSLQSDDGSPRTECETAASKIHPPPKKKNNFHLFFCKLGPQISSAAIFFSSRQEREGKTCTFFWQLQRHTR